MSDEAPESEWFNISFDFKIVGTEVGMPAPDQRRTLLRGLAQAVAFLLLPDQDYTGIKVYAGSLRLTSGELFNDTTLNALIDQWKDEET